MNTGRLREKYDRLKKEKKELSRQLKMVAGQVEEYGTREETLM